jgi:hypothetical protein
VADGKAACVLAPIAIKVAHSSALGVPNGVTVGRGVVVGVGTTEGADVQSDRIINRLTTANMRRISPPMCAVLLSAYTPITSCQEPNNNRRVFC